MPECLVGGTNNIMTIFNIKRHYLKMDMIISGLHGPPLAAVPKKAPPFPPSWAPLLTSPYKLSGI